MTRIMYEIIRDLLKNSSNQNTGVVRRLLRKIHFLTRVPRDTKAVVLFRREEYRRGKKQALDIHKNNCNTKS